MLIIYCKRFNPIIRTIYISVKNTTILVIALNAIPKFREKEREKEITRIKFIKIKFFCLSKYANIFAWT